MTLAIPEAAWQMIETAAKLLEADGYVVRPGLYGPWIVCPTMQWDALGYVCFLLPSQ